MVCTSGTSGFKVKTLRIRVQTQLLFPEQAQRDPTGKVCKRLANPIRTQPGLVQPVGGGGGVRLIKQEEAGLKPHSRSTRGETITTVYLAALADGGTPRGNY